MIHLFIVDYYDPNKSNGLSTYITELSQSLSGIPEINLGYILLKSEKNGKVMTCDRMEKGQLMIHIPGDIGRNGINGEYDREVADFIAKITDELEKVVVHFNWINHCTFAPVLKKKINCKTVLTKHCIPWRDFIVGKYAVFSLLDKQLYARKRQLYLHRELVREQAAYISMDRIICVTQFAQNVLTTLFNTPSERIAVIDNGISFRGTFEKDKASLRQQYGFTAKEEIILYVGGINERKGLYDLLTVLESIAARRSDVRLVISGEGDCSRLFDRIKRYWAKVTLTGKLDKKTLYEFYRMADVGVAPSYVEQCSYAVIEMMRSGLPVVVADVDGLREIVPDNCGLKVRLVQEKNVAHIDTSDLKEKILYFLENTATASEYASRALSYALNRFEAKRMAAETMKVYSDLFESVPDNDRTTKVTPLVTVLLPCYNAEQYIADCIESVLDQTWHKFELIVIDDGSSDRTTDIIRSYKDNRIVLVRNDKNEGIVQSLNTGIKIAKGKYIARIDADDMMHADRLDKQVRFLEAQPEVSVVGSWIRVIDQYDKPIGLMDYPTDDEGIKISISFLNPFCHPAVMIRSDVLKKFRYSARYKHCEDFHLWFRLAANHNMANIPEYLTSYRIHSDNVSTINNKVQRENALELIDTSLRKMGVDCTVEELSVHAAIYFRTGIRYFNTKEKVNALKLWLKKVFETGKLNERYGKNKVKRIEKYLISNCGIADI